jgi:hypothetical protein
MQFLQDIIKQNKRKISYEHSREKSFKKSANPLLR